MADDTDGKQRFYDLWAQARALAEAMAPSYLCEDASRDLEKLSKNSLPKQQRIPLAGHLNRCPPCMQKAHELMQAMEQKRP